LQPAIPKETVARVQLVVENIPGESETKVTLPVGVVLAPPEASVTVAVQLDPWPTTTGVVQLTAVVVARGLIVTLFEKTAE